MGIIRHGLTGIADETEVKVAHIMPDGRVCGGLFVISYAFWADALKSRAMGETGSVSGACKECNRSGFVDKNKKLVNLG